MKFTRVLTKNTNRVVNVISANTGELLALASVMNIVSGGKPKVSLINESGNGDQTIVVHDSYFELDRCMKQTKLGERSNPLKLDGYK